MGRPSSKWDDRTFANRGDVSFGTAPLAVWDPTYLHLAPAVYVLSADTIYTYLAGYPNVTLLGPYGAIGAGAEIIRCPKTVYVPAPYVSLLSSGNLTPVESWNRLHGAIVDAGPRMPVGLSSTGCAPQSFDPAPTHIPRSWSPLHRRPYLKRSSSSTATGYFSSTCPASNQSSTARQEPVLPKRSER